jgi:hypothetical protein
MAIQDSSQHHAVREQFATIKQYLKRRSNSPPSPTDTALNQLMKGCQMAMQSAAILADENERLRVANERQVKKLQVTRKYISKAITLAVADAQELINRNIEV